MIRRDYRFTLTGNPRGIVYSEGYYATYEEALADMTNVCSNTGKVFDTIPEDTIIATISELVPSSQGYTYINARMEYLFRDHREPERIIPSGKNIEV